MTATAAANIFVTLSDPAAQDAGIVYWNMVQSWSRKLVELSQSLPPDLQRALEMLQKCPSDLDAFDRLRGGLERSSREAVVAKLLTEAWIIETKSRIGYTPGCEVTSGLISAVTADELMTGQPRTTADAGEGEARTSVIIPIRDSGQAGRGRLRNLVACLRALSDQTAPAGSYSVVVVETDTEPRWQDLLSPWCTKYLFAYSNRPFNRSWALNVGVRHGEPGAELVCLMDADVLADRGFIGRNVARFDVPGRGALNPYRDMFCMDRSSTDRAIRERIFQEAPSPSLELARGFRLRRPRGCLLWVRREAFDRVGGFDERYEGWGGEDYDFIHRLDYVTPIDSFEDPLPHMYHPPSSVLLDTGELVTSNVPALSWPATSVFGSLDRFSHAES